MSIVNKTVIAGVVLFFLIVLGLPLIEKEKNHGNNNIIHVPKNYKLTNMDQFVILGHVFDHNDDCKCKTYGGDEWVCISMRWL